MTIEDYSSMDRNVLTAFVASALQTKDYIALIKLYRALSKGGLKESKDVIESCAYHVGSERYFAENRVWDVFRPFLNPSQPTTSHKMLPSHREAMLTGITTAMDHYYELGFQTPKDAVLAILNNF